MITYLLILSESEGISIRAAHLPRPGDTIDVVKDYGARERLRFVVETVQHDVTVADVPDADGNRGVVETVPFVMGKVVARKVEGVWRCAMPGCNAPYDPDSTLCDRCGLRALFGRGA